MANPALSNLTIRRANHADRASLHQLLVRSWLTSWAPHLPAECVRRFHDTDPTSAWLATDLEQIDVAVLDEKIVAAMQVRDKVLEDIHVDPDFKRQGIGSMLLRRDEELGARRLLVRAFNGPAMAFYEAHGWVNRRRFAATELGTPVETVEYVKT